MIKYRKKISFLLTVIILMSFAFSMIIPTGCSPNPPLKLRDLNPVMPGDDPNDYDVYRVVVVKKDVTEQELGNLMRYFTELYIDENRVKIYVFNDAGSTHLGISEGLVSTFFKDQEKNLVQQDIQLNKSY